MTTLRIAAQQALEALGAMNPYPASKEDQRASALAALRAALAQQDEPVQEPVAWLYEEGADSTLHWNKPPLYGTPLYTAPPQRKLVPLTEAEIEHIGITHQSLRQVARAVERAVWEKNNG